VSYRTKYDLINQKCLSVIGPTTDPQRPTGLKEGDRMETPRGKEELIEVFGNIYEYINEDGTLKSREWEDKILGFCYLPFPMILAWDKSKTILRFRCHKLLSGTFDLVFKIILHEKLEGYCQYFGGCYSFRVQVGSKKVTTHAWAVSIDLNPETNQLGTEGDIHQGIVKVFEDQGFVHGRGFKRLDPMHWQFIKNY